MSNDFGPLPPAPTPPPPPSTLEEALNRLAYGDRGVIDRPAYLAFIRERIDAEAAANVAAALRGATAAAQEAIAAAVLAEREACARVADGYDSEVGGADNPASLIAAAIRARDPAAEHPAVALLRELEWSGGACPSCGAPHRPRGELDPEGRHTPGCRLAALLHLDDAPGTAKVTPEDLRARLCAALESILPAGSQVRLDVTLPAKVDRIEATIGFKEPEPAPPDLQAIINEVAKKVAPDMPPPRLVFDRAPMAGALERPSRPMTAAEVRALHDAADALEVLGEDVATLRAIVDAAEASPLMRAASADPKEGPTTEERLAAEVRRLTAAVATLTRERDDANRRVLWWHGEHERIRHVCSDTHAALSRAHVPRTEHECLHESLAARVEMLLGTQSTCGDGGAA